MRRCAVRRVVQAALLASAVAVLVPAAAVAAESATIQAGVNADGSGTLSANADGNPPEQTWSWQACAPGLSSCTPFAAGRSITTAGAAPNTLFRATSSLGASAPTPVWHGEIAALTPPSVAGVVRANRFVTPVLGSWSGGWDGDVHLTQLAACANADGTGCTTLTDLNSIGCKGGAAVLDAVFTGRYLRVTDQDVGPNPIFAAYAVTSPYYSRTWVAAASTSVAVVGRIAPASGPRTVHCGPSPLPFAKASLSRRGVAAVQCPYGCLVALIGKRGSRTVRLMRDLPRHSRVSLRLSPTALTRLGRGRILLSVEINGTRAARRTVIGAAPMRA
jgi:hypothetical protein